jgi:hypothetical protein
MNEKFIKIGGAKAWMKNILRLNIKLIIYIYIYKNKISTH